MIPAGDEFLARYCDGAIVGWEIAILSLPDLDNVNHVNGLAMRCSLILVLSHYLSQFYSNGKEPSVQDEMTPTFPEGRPLKWNSDGDDVWKNFGAKKI